ncbi:MAG: Fic family protein [Kiritimatiellia bacterium]
MSYEPLFTITPHLLSRIEHIAALRERIMTATVDVAWIPALQMEACARTVHSSTAIEGNPLTLEQVRAVAKGRDVPAIPDRARQEVVNYFAGLRFIEKNTGKKPIGHEDILELHRIVAGKVMDQGEAGRYRIIRVRVGAYMPPPPEDVSGLMFELLKWWNSRAADYSPVISSAVLHYRFEAIHPFADGNGRTGRALALWELYRREFDTHRIFSVDEFYWDDRERYYKSLQSVRKAGDDLTAWLEYAAEGIEKTLTAVWKRIGLFSAHAVAPKLTLRPRQEQLLHFLRERGAMTPAEIWEVVGVSRQGAMDLLKPLLKAGLVIREGGKKTGRYRLADFSSISGTQAN